MNSLELIGECIERLAAEYDLALALVGFDESMVTMQLPAEWSVLVRKVCALITAEVDKRNAMFDATGPAAEPCAGCGGRLWFVCYDPVAQGHHVQCAACGMVCHV